MDKIAIKYLKAGLSVLPARRVEKRPAIGGWKDYQNRLPSEQEAAEWLKENHDAICIVTGKVSGNAEILDFDNQGELYDAWAASIPPELLAKLVVETTQRGGRHVFYRCESEADGNQKLAQRRGTDGKLLTLIETRGEGGLFICSPTQGYNMLQGDMSSPPILTKAERDTLIKAAVALTEIPLTPTECSSSPMSPLAPSQTPLQLQPSSASDRPGDDFNQRGNIRKILIKHGWKLIRKDSKNEHWQRPGKNDEGSSATFDGKHFYVFSTNAAPFESEKPYTLFAVYAMLEHGGDWSAAASSLKQAGFGGDTSEIPAPILIKAADVKHCKTKWLWPKRVPMGRITLLVGKAGGGKSFLTTYMAATVSNGTKWPDGTDCPQGSVILISMEDDAGSTIRPRLDAHGANVNKVMLLQGIQEKDKNGKIRDVMFTLNNVPSLEAALKATPDCRLIVIDPIGSFIGGKTDANSDNAVRSILDPVAKLAEKYGIAILVVAHRRKSGGSNADDLALGSRAFTALARVVWHLTCDKDNKARRLLLPGKNNLAAAGNGLAFSIEDGIEDDPGTLVWERDPVNMTADDALAQENGFGENAKPGPDPKAQNQAADWLVSELADMQEHSVKDLQEVAKAGGLVWRSVQRASQRLGVKMRRGQFGGGCVWQLPKPTTTIRTNPVEN